MNNGMRVKGSDGQVQLDDSAFTCRIVYAETVSPNTWAPGTSYIDVPIADITPQNSIAFCVPLGPINYNSDRQLEPEVINGAARVWRRMKGYTTTASWISLTAMTLVVVRFK